MSSEFTSTRCFIFWTEKKLCLFWLTLQFLLILYSFSVEQKGNMDYIQSEREEDRVKREGEKQAELKDLQFTKKGVALIVSFLSLAQT